MLSVVLGINVRVNVSSLLFSCLMAWYMKLACFGFQGLQEKSSLMFSRRLVVPGKVFVANRRNGITKPFSGNTNMSINSLSSCIRKNRNPLQTPV